MRGLFWILALFGLAVAVSLGASLNQGYVLLVLPPWRMEISFNLFIVAAILLFAATYVVLRSLSVTFRLPARVKAHREQVRREKAGAVFQDAVRLLFEGRFGQALKKAMEAHGNGTATGLSALIAARAAQRMRDPEKQQGWLERAKNDDPRTEAATLMLEAEMLNDSRRFDEAVAVLKRFQEKHGRHLAALRLELRARQGCQDWDGVLRVARQLEKRGALPGEVAREVKLQAHLASVADRAGEASRLKSYLKEIPKAECAPRLMAAAARGLIGLGADSEAQGLIEGTLDGSDESAWQTDLVALYGFIQGGDITSRIARAEHWLRGHPGDAGLLLTLGRLCVRQRLWGKAQSYLEASLAVAQTRDAHLELAHLFDQLERTEEANRHYRQSATITTL